MKLIIEEKFIQYLVTINFSYNLQPWKILTIFRDVFAYMTLFQVLFWLRCYLELFIFKFFREAEWHIDMSSASGSEICFRIWRSPDQTSIKTQIYQIGNDVGSLRFIIYYNLLDGGASWSIGLHHRLRRQGWRDRIQIILILLFFQVILVRRNVSLRKWAEKKRRDRKRRREWRKEEERPAGISGKRVSSPLNTSPRGGGLGRKSGLVSGRSRLTCRKKMVRFEGN